MDIRVQGYENQVRLFLILLVLFVVAAGAVALQALFRTQALLTQEAEGRITSTSRAVQRELIDSGAAAPESGPAGSAAASRRLRELARAYGLSSLEIVDRQGRVLASTQPWRHDVIDPVAAGVAARDPGGLASGGAVLREPDAARPDDEYGPDRGEVLVFLALGAPDGTNDFLLKAGHEVLGVRTVARQIRWLAWLQAAAGVVMVALVLLFARWVLRPYRALRATAAQIESVPARPGARGLGEPEDLISSFRGVIDKLKEQELEMDRMRAHSRPGGAGGLSQVLLDGLTSGVLIIARDGRITALNPAGESILGVSRASLIGRDYLQAFAASPDLLAILRDGVDAGRARSREVVAYEGRPGGRAHLGVTVSSIPSAEGEQDRSVFCLFSDLTEIRGLQDRVRVKENLASLGEMSAGIAHEFRNSLATILGYARLIARPANAEDEVAGPAGPAADHAAAIAREVEAIGRVVDDFLRYARPAVLHASAWDPRETLEQVASEVGRQDGRPGVRIEIDGVWPAEVQADEGLLRQAFKNLLRNAVEAIDSERGLVTVTGSMEKDAEGADHLRIEVADSGGGIREDLIDRLFTPFVTTKRQGTGLGLALAQKAIVSHDGAISARNLEGGACFTVRLPLPAVQPALVDRAEASG